MNTVVYLILAKSYQYMWHGNYYIFIHVLHFYVALFVRKSVNRYMCIVIKKALQQIALMTCTL